MQKRDKHIGRQGDDEYHQKPGQNYLGMKFKY